MAGLARRLASIPIQDQKRDPIPIEMSAYSPDRPPLANPGMSSMKNGFPQENMTYGPWRAQQVVSTNQLDSICRGLSVATDVDGEGFLYAGSLKALYQYKAGLFEDVSKAGGYTLTEEQRWDQTAFAGTLVATNFNDPVQGRPIGGSGAVKYADLITSVNKPKARFCAQLRDFLLLGYTQDDVDGERPNRIWWSAFGDPTDFDPSATTQSDFDDAKSGGNITGLVGGAEYGVVFQEAQIRRMTYVGPSQIFTIQPADRQRGCRVSNSIIPHGRLIFYYGDEGFQVFDGTTSQPIGGGYVDQEVAKFFDVSDAFKVVSAKDPVNKIAIWGFPVAGSETAIRLFFYNWGTGMWGEGEADAAALSISLSESSTVDGLGFNIDTDPLGDTLVDGSIWKGGNILVSAADGNNNLAVYSGSTLSSSFVSGERQLFAGQRAQALNGIPLVDGTARMRVIQREDQDDGLIVTPQTITPAIAKDRNGKCNFRGVIPVSRYHRFEVTLDAGDEWNNFQGCLVYADPAGPYKGTG